MLVAWIATACGRADATPKEQQPPPPASTRAASFETQLVGADPCGRLTAAEVSTALRHALRGVPVRVASAESVSPSATGSGCLYELEPEAGREPGMVTLEVKTDGVEMQGGLGAAAMGDFASAAGRWSAKWDWVSGLPAGLFAARQGHVGILIAINAAGISPRDVEPLAARLLAKVPDVPFTDSPTDPSAPGINRDPCVVLTRAEAEAALGKLVAPPFRSRPSTPIAYGRGSSCTYYAPGHRVVILTPHWSEGRAIYEGLRGVAALVRERTGEQATTSTPGPWDARTTGVAGTLNFVKGDRMLELQYRASGTDEATALRIATAALGRM